MGPVLYFSGFQTKGGGGSGLLSQTTGTGIEHEYTEINIIGREARTSENCYLSQRSLVLSTRTLSSMISLRPHADLLQNFETIVGFIDFFVRTLSLPLLPRNPYSCLTIMANTAFHFASETPSSAVHGALRLLRRSTP